MKSILLMNIFFLILLAGCKSSHDWPPEPVTVHLAEDSCAACKMIISQESYGAQIHEPGKPVQLFDDYGCLLSQRIPGDSGTRFIYVRASEDGHWIPEDQATYVISKQIPSPMGYGVAAFATKESAAKLAAQFGDSKLYSISELIAASEKILAQGSQIKE